MGGLQPVSDLIGRMCGLVLQPVLEREREGKRGEERKEGKEEWRRMTGKMESEEWRE